MKVIDMFGGNPDPRHRDDVPLEAAWTTLQRHAEPDPKPADELERELDEARAYGLAQAQLYYRAGRRGRALYELVRSVERQIRIAGLGSHEIRPASLQTEIGWWPRP